MSYKKIRTFARGLWVKARKSIERSLWGPPLTVAILQEEHARDLVASIMEALERLKAGEKLSFEDADSLYDRIQDFLQRGVILLGLIRVEEKRALANEDYLLAVRLQRSRAPLEALAKVLADQEAALKGDTPKRAA